MVEKVILDTPVFIYWLEQDPTHFAAAKRLMSEVETGKRRGVTSVLCVSETMVMPYRARRADLQQKYRAIFGNFPNLEVLPVSADVAYLAAELRAEYGFEMGDAVVGATALVASCSRIVTNDRDLKKMEDRGVKVDTLGRQG